MSELSLYVIPIVLGFLLDLLLGDPPRWPHPVRLIGWLIVKLENLLRRVGTTVRRQLLAGTLLTFTVVLSAFIVPLALLKLALNISPYLYVVIATILCYQVIAVKCLRVESMAVYDCLTVGDLAAARQAVSRIVGRDTQTLDQAQIAKATVETIVENSTDGVVAPLFYLCLGGPALGWCYKAINTLDSMIGYKNSQYLYFGRAAARLDDIANYIPARLCAMVMLLAAKLPGMDYCPRRGWRIWRRDRYNHASPNSAQTEAMYAGLAGIQLAGDAYYQGVLVKKPSIGDHVRSIAAVDICRANQLMYVTATLAVVIFVCIAVVGRYLY